MSKFRERSGSREQMGRARFAWTLHLSKSVLNAKLNFKYYPSASVGRDSIHFLRCMPSPQTKRSDARAINGQDLIDWLTNIMMGPALSAGQEELSQLPTARNFFLCPASHFFSVSLSLISSLSCRAPIWLKAPAPARLFCSRKVV